MEAEKERLKAKDREAAKKKEEVFFFVFFLKAIQREATQKDETLLMPRSFHGQKKRREALLMPRSVHNKKKQNENEACYEMKRE
jgi:hypothetical protein